MKIVVIGPIHPWRGGIAHSNTMLCTNLAKKHNLTVISFKRLYPKLLFPGKFQKCKEKRKLSFKVNHIIDSINPLTWNKVILLIKKSSPDLIILQWWTTFLTPLYSILIALIRRVSKAKICFLCQNVLQHESKHLDKFLTKVAFGKVDYFIVMSSSDLRDLKDIVPKAKAKILIEPTYDTIFEKEPISKQEAKRQLGLKGNILLFFGFVRPYKGLKYLINAMPIVLKKVKLNLLIVGEFWEGKEDYLRQIKKLKISDKIQIIDKYVPDDKVSLYMSCADALVLPYTSATQSAILQTAYGFNKPVITSKVGSLLDLVQPDKTGLLVEPKNPKKLAEAIIKFYDKNLETKFVKNIRKSKKVFEWGDDKEKILFFGIGNLYKSD